MVNGDCFVAEARDEYAHAFGVGVKIRPDDRDINGIVLALEDFIACVFEKLKERIFALMTIFYLFKKNSGSSLYGRNGLKGIGNKLSGGIKIDVFTRLIGQGDNCVPVTLRGIAGNGNLLWVLETKVERPVAGFLDDGGLRGRPTNTEHRKH